MLAAVLFGEGELGLPPGLNTAAMPWWVQALFMAAILGVNAYLLVKFRNAEIRKTETDTDLKKEAAREAAKREDDDSAIGQWKAIARDAIKRRGEDEERHRKQMLETEETHNKKMAEIVAATRTEIHEVRNELGARITRADEEIADLRHKEWKCQKRMARFEGIARAKGWDISGEPEDNDDSNEFAQPPDTRESD